ncbi:MAG: CTP synthetase, partial [Candidatus Daviesbacteria bacterium GW2011_GWA2_42_7]
ELENYQGIIVPGGFGSRDIEGKLSAIKYCRENKVPYLGLCYGMQLAVVEYARHILKMDDANTTEVDPETKNAVIHIMPDQKKKLLARDYGATMRLGAWDCLLQKGSLVKKLYGKSKISERHRHRYEFNNEFVDKFLTNGMRISGASSDGKLVEVIELLDHPFFVGTQFHPELKSRPLEPHPLFLGFLKAASKIDFGR